MAGKMLRGGFKTKADADRWMKENNVVNGSVTYSSQYGWTVGGTMPSTDWRPLTPEEEAAVFNPEEWLAGLPKTPTTETTTTVVTDPNVDWWNKVFGWLPGVYETGEAQTEERLAQPEFPLMTALPPQSEWPTGFYPVYKAGTATTPGGYYWEASPTTQEGATTGAATIRWETISEGGWDYMVGYDGEGNITAKEPLGRTETDEMSEYEREALAIQKSNAARDIEQWQAELEAEQAYRNRYLDITQQQNLWQQQQAEREYGAKLAAEPVSWLQHAAYTGQTPVVQPWQKPLMPEQYGNLEVGQPIPGYTQTNMAGMPSLTNPSRQYQARMGPTALQQYYGYQQGQTGARPEETQFRLWSSAPPSGGYHGLSYARP